MTAAAVPFRVLVVCTGNICRSPYAERLLRWSFADLAVRAGRFDWARVEVTSAGIEALIGEPMDPPMAGLLAASGIDPGGHVARAIDRDLVAGADLILTATREHRRDVVRLLPRASRNAFALPEFIRLLEDAERAGTLTIGDAIDAPEILRAATESAADRRGFAEAPEDATSDDVPDPYRRSRETYERAAAQLADITERIMAILERVVVDRSIVGSGR